MLNPSIFLSYWEFFHLFLFDFLSLLSSLFCLYVILQVSVLFVFVSYIKFSLVCVLFLSVSVFDKRILLIMSTVRP